MADIEEFVVVETPPELKKEISRESKFSDNYAKLLLSLQQ